jgi:guanylate kinase
MWNKSSRMHKYSPLIFVISGPSGSGKTTLAKKLLKQPKLKHRFIKSISYTTREKRPGERSGRDYFFIKPQEFQRLLNRKKFLEHTHYLGYDYATPRDCLRQAKQKGLNVILCLDFKGARFVKNRYPDRTITIFVKPPSLNTARERILARCAKTKLSEVNKRIQLASKELSQITRFDYYLVNDNLNSAIKQTERIILCHISR